MNRIRREHEALQFNDRLHFHATDNDQLIAYSKVREGPNGKDVVLTVVNLDHHHAQSGWVTVDLDVVGFSGALPYTAHDLLSDARFTWTAGSNFVSLDPLVVPCHILALTQDALGSGGGRVVTTTDVTRERRPADPEAFGIQPTWYKDAVIYEAHVRAFRDGNGDGIGDFRGLIEKLDYLQGLGVTAIWLLPFYPSPLRDDGYDISDYRQVHPSYGNLRDFRLFLREAHRRGMRVITELVLAHTSDQHPWFQRARSAHAGSNYRNFYLWNDTPDRFSEARVIFKDFESSNWTFDPVADAYFWHRFYSHQPSLNYDNPSVRQAMFDVVDFWLSMGVDGLRLDAVPYLYAREGTTCENLPETFEFLRQLCERTSMIATRIECFSPRPINGPRTQ